MEQVVKQTAAAESKTQPQQAPAVVAEPAPAVAKAPVVGVKPAVVEKPAAKAPARPAAKPAVKPAAKGTAKQAAKPVAKAVAKPAAAKPATAKRPAAKPVAKAPAKKSVAKAPTKETATKAPAKQPVVKAPAKRPVQKPDSEAVRPIPAEEGMKRIAATLKPGCENEVVLRHSLQVARLVGQLFDQLGSFHALDKVWRERLLWAGLLHDFAYNQGKKGHHKAAKKLIEQDVTLPLSAGDRPFVALLARFHRKAVPTMKHRDLLSLPVEERRRMIAASALLRLADGLDYQHDQNVEKVECAFDKKTLGVLVHAKGKVKSDLARAHKKAKALVSAKLVISALERTVKPLREVKPVVKAAARPAAKPAVKQATTAAAKPAAAKPAAAKRPAAKTAATKTPAAKPAVKTVK